MNAMINKLAEELIDQELEEALLEKLATNLLEEEDELAYDDDDELDSILEKDASEMTDEEVEKLAFIVRSALDKVAVAPSARALYRAGRAFGKGRFASARGVLPAKASLRRSSYQVGRTFGKGRVGSAVGALTPREKLAILMAATAAPAGAAGAAIDRRRQAKKRVAR